MSLKQWYRSRRVNFVLALICMMLAASHVFIYEQLSKDVYSFIIIFLASLIGFAYFTMRSVNCYMGIIELQSHLGVRNVKQYIELSPSKMEDMCLRRLKELGYAWDEANKNYPMPFAEERVKAESAFKKAERFFVATRCIKPTKWDRFFPKSETQK